MYRNNGDVSCNGIVGNDGIGKVRREGDDNTENRRQRKHIERCFGFYGCRNCKNDWKSAYTWRIAGTLKVYNLQ